MTTAPGNWFTASTDPDAVFYRTQKGRIENFGGCVGDCFQAYRGVADADGELDTINDPEWVAVSVVSRVFKSWEEAGKYLAKIQQESR